MAMTFSDARNKEIALGNIRRLASSVLTLEPFVLALFQLIHDAISSASSKAFLCDPIANPTAGVANSRDVHTIAVPYLEYFMRADSKRSAMTSSSKAARLRNRFASQENSSDSNASMAATLRPAVQDRQPFQHF
ncbi:MAG: hypothetical protein ABSD31_15880 [Candidatus Binataceae bacterium]|jgi:hypothetical protein